MNLESYALYLYLKKEKDLNYGVMLLAAALCIILIGIPFAVVASKKYNRIAAAYSDLERACEYYGVPRELRQYFNQNRNAVDRYAINMHDQFLDEVEEIRKKSKKKWPKEMSEQDWLSCYGELHRSIGLKVLNPSAPSNIRRQMAAYDTPSANAKLEKERKQQEEMNRQWQIQEQQRLIQEQQRLIQEQQRLNEQMMQQMNDSLNKFH